MKLSQQIENMEFENEMMKEQLSHYEMVFQLLLKKEDELFDIASNYEDEHLDEMDSPNVKKNFEILKATWFGAYELSKIIRHHTSVEEEEE